MPPPAAAMAGHRAQVQGPGAGAPLTACRPPYSLADSVLPVSSGLCSPTPLCLPCGTRSAAMAIFDRLRGKRQEETVDPSTAVAAAAVSPNLDLTLTEAPSAVHHEPASSRDTLKPFGMSVEDTTRLYNPYEGAAATCAGQESSCVHPRLPPGFPPRPNSVSSRLAADTRASG